MIEWDSTRHAIDRYDTVLFDASRSAPWVTGTHNANSLFHVVASYPAALQAVALGVLPRDHTGTPIQLADAILVRPDGSVVRDLEALAATIHTLAGASSGMPSRYDATASDGIVPRRRVCTGVGCT